MKTIFSLFFIAAAAMAAESTIPLEGAAAPAFKLPSQEGTPVSLGVW